MIDGERTPLGLISLDYESWDECVADAVRRGIRLVEVYVDHATTDDDVRRLRRKCETSDVSVTAIGCLAKLAQAEDDLPDHLALIHRCIDVAAALEVSRVTFMYGGCAVLSRRDARLRFLDRLEPLVERAETSGIHLLIENVFSRSPSGDLDTVESTQALFDLLRGDVVRLNFDVGNYAIAGEETYPYALEVLRPHIGSVHLKDVARYWAPRHGDVSGCRPLIDHARGLFVTEPLGDGAVNCTGLLRSLMNGPRVPLMLESFSNGPRRDWWLDRSLRFLHSLDGLPTREAAHAVGG